jgi:hypothetical protein
VLPAQLDLPIKLEVSKTDESLVLDIVKELELPSSHTT